MRRAALVGLILGQGPVGCAPKEALDPSEIIEEDPDLLPPGYEEGTPGERSPSEHPAGQLATRAECEGAARHLERLGLRLAIAGAESPEERAALEAQERELSSSAEVRSRIEQSTTDCIGRETPAREARCISRVASMDQIEKCTR